MLPRLVWITFITPSFEDLEDDLYQYAKHLLVWKGDQSHCLEGNECIRMLGFPSGYLKLQDGTEDDV